MKESVERAGILDARVAGDIELSFISESEAAALTVLEDLSGRGDVKVGDHFIVCDAGGGTVLSPVAWLFVHDSNLNHMIGHHYLYHLPTQSTRCTRECQG